jgi:hypothetical protein
MRPTAVLAFPAVPLGIVAPALFENATVKTPGMAVRDSGATAE